MGLAVPESGTYSPNDSLQSYLILKNPQLVT